MIKLKTHCGQEFTNVCQEVYQITINKYEFVEFEFNGIKVFVNANTKLDKLYRDYHNAHLLGWKTIGPEPPNEYPPHTIALIAEKTKEAEKKRKKDMQNNGKKKNIKSGFICKKPKI